MTDQELRDHARTLAVGLLADTLVTYVAALTKRGLCRPEHGLAIVDEWARACHEMGAHASLTLDDARALSDEGAQISGLESALLGMLHDHESDDHVAALVHARMRQLLDDEETDTSAAPDDQDFPDPTRG
jgi:hypothetical protein